MNILYHRNDLRTKDNKALELTGKNTAPIFIFEPEKWTHRLASDSRKEFTLESLKDLNRQYMKLGTELKFFEGDPIDILSEMVEQGHEIYFNQDANHFFQQKEKILRNKFNAVNGDAVINCENGRPENWAEIAKNWFESKQHETPESISDNELSGNISLNQIRERYDVNPDKEKFGKGGTYEAKQRLTKFLENIDSYSGCISSPSKAESKTSHLSPYIRKGCLSPRQVYQKVKTEADTDNNERSMEMFKDRIFWQQHFNQKIEDNSTLFKEAINPVYRDLNKDRKDEEKIQAWKNGRTGFPLIDASMRALKRTGWLNFRMRAMCASFFSYILKQWWKIGADHFYKHLIDADVAINYYQWQMQSGLVGVHANRIYNPTKQVNENDPNGNYIRKYVTELENLPQEFIDKPWKMPERIQEKNSIIIGEDYPEPIVNYDREARKAREFFKANASSAYAAFKDDKVWKKASLSFKHSRDDILEKGDESQKDLKSFYS
jgi:deoxyribodipyrimidine photo-lyase